MSLRDLPDRPSLDSLRRQAKKLARDAAAGNDDAVARIRAQSPGQAFPLSNRHAQLVIAREYGFGGWQDLTAEVQKRLGRSLDWAAAQAKLAIHNEDYERLRTLLAEYPALVSWRDESGETLLSSTIPYALDVSDAERERRYTRPVAAEMLIDAGMTVERSTWEYLIATGASGMLTLLARKNALPLTLPILAALGDDEAVRARLANPGDRDRSEEANERTVIKRALMSACRFKHSGLALRLLERAIALDRELGRRVDRWRGRQAFVAFLIQHPGSHWSGGPTEGAETLWEAFVIRQLTSALDDNDLPAFRRWLEDEPWLLEPAFVHIQIGVMERVCWKRSQEQFITTLLEHGPAVLRIEPRPPSQAIAFALSYGNAHLVPVLTRVWPLPHDLAHAAGIGNAAGVAGWFDASGKPVLRSLTHQYPGNDPLFKGADLGWGPVTTQHVLDVALAWAVLNRHFEIASFLLERGADINTNWSTHEPASILHEAAIQENEEAVRFLIESGADLTIKDYRYNATAEGWARYAAHNERLADLLGRQNVERTVE